MPVLNIDPTSLGATPGVQRWAAESWATILAASVGTDHRDNLRLGNQDGTPKYNCNRFFLWYNTATLPVGAVIDSVTVKMTGNSKSLESGESSSKYGFTLFSGNNGNPPALEDFDQFGTTPFSNEITYDNWSTTGNNIFTLNAAGIAAINKSGTTKLCCRIKRDYGNDAPPGSGNYGDGVNNVVAGQMTITYHFPAGSPLIFSGGVVA